MGPVSCVASRSWAGQSIYVSALKELEKDLIDMI